jgi:hypothetical protein
MSLHKVYQGEDVSVVISLKNADTTPIQASSMLDYMVTICTTDTTGRATNMVVFKKTPGQGESEIAVHDDLAGELLCVIDRTATATALPGIYQLEFKAKFAANENYIDSEITEIEKNEALFELCKTINRTVL